MREFRRQTIRYLLAMAAICALLAPVIGPVRAIGLFVEATPVGTSG